MRNVTMNQTKALLTVIVEIHCVEAFMNKNNWFMLFMKIKLTFEIWIFIFFYTFTLRINVISDFNKNQIFLLSITLIVWTKYGRVKIIYQSNLSLSTCPVSSANLDSIAAGTVKFGLVRNKVCNHKTSLQHFMKQNHINYNVLKAICV